VSVWQFSKMLGILAVGDKMEVVREKYVLADMDQEQV
jgi:hypothetical protein